MQFFTTFLHLGPNALEDAQVHPALEGPMHRGVIRILARQMIPLTARLQSEDDGIKCRARVDAFATTRLGGIILIQNGFDDVLEGIGCLPDGWQGRSNLLRASHGRLFSSGKRSHVTCHSEIVS